MTRAGCSRLIPTSCFTPRTGIVSNTNRHAGSSKIAPLATILRSAICDLRSGSARALPTAPQSRCVGDPAESTRCSRRLRDMARQSALGPDRKRAGDGQGLGHCPAPEHRSTCRIRCPYRTDTVPPRRRRIRHPQHPGLRRLRLHSPDQSNRQRGLSGTRRTIAFRIDNTWATPTPSATCRSLSTNAPRRELEAKGSISPQILCQENKPIRRLKERIRKEMAQSQTWSPLTLEGHAAGFAGRPCFDANGTQAVPPQG